MHSVAGDFEFVSSNVFLFCSLSVFVVDILWRVNVTESLAVDLLQLLAVQCSL